MIVHVEGLVPEILALLLSSYDVGSERLRATGAVRLLRADGSDLGPIERAEVAAWLSAHQGAQERFYRPYYGRRTPNMLAHEYRGPYTADVVIAWCRTHRVTAELREIATDVLVGYVSLEGEIIQV